MKTSTKPTPTKVTINPNLKSNPTDPYIQKKIEKATQILNTLKEPLVL